MWVRLLVLGGRFGSGVMGGWMGAAGVDLGLHSMSMLEEAEVEVGGNHGHGVGLEESRGR